VLTFGERLKTIRTWQALSGGELAEKIGCSQAALSMWESNKRLPSLKQFRSLCKALNIPYSMMLEGVALDNTEEDITE
jgi:transcriptional regulator with XRE-family HTH domain